MDGAGSGMTSRKGRRDEDDKNGNNDGDTVKAKSSTLVGENKSDVAKEDIRTEYCDNNVSDVKAVVQVTVVSDGCADDTDKEKYSIATSTTKECNVKDGARRTVKNTNDDIDSDGTDKGGGDTYIKTENSSNAVSDKNINSSNILPEKVKDKKKEHGGGSSKCKNKKSQSEHGSACEGSTKKGLVHSVENKDKVVKTTAKKSGGSVENKNDGNTELEVVRGDEDDGDDDATDVEYYEQSYKASEEPPTAIIANKGERPAKRPLSKEDCVCPVCYDDFTFIHDLRQHLIHDDCQPEDGESFDCDICTLSFADVDEFKDHRLSHMDKSLFWCTACGTKFASKRALDKHMFVDASILNKLRSSKEVVSLPDLLCRTVVDILAESAGVFSGSTRKTKKTLLSSDDEEVEDGEDGDWGVSKAKKTERKGEVEEEEEEEEDMDEDEDNDEEHDEDDDEVGEDCDESNLPSEIEQDLEEAEDSEEAVEVSKIPQPFISSSLTDAPMTPFSNNNHDNDDSVTSLSHNSAEDAVEASANAFPSSSSRRKSKHPMQVQRVAPAPPEALTPAEPIIKVEPEDEEEVTPAGQSPTDLTSLICTMCGDRLLDKRKLDLHISEHEKLFPFFCSLCDANFMEGKLLKAHVASCHSANQSLQCQMCGMYFKLRGSLATHMKFCRQAPACVVCGENFKTGPDLEKHYYSHSLEERASAEFLSCSDCGEVFVSTMQLREHQKSHGSMRPFSCEVCGGSFTQQKTLDKHREVHFRQQDCKCEICGVQLLTRSGYIAHLRGHRNNESLQMGLDEKLLALLEEKGGHPKPRKGKKKKEEGVEKRNLTLDTMEYLKLIEEQLSSLESASMEKSKRSMNYAKTRIHSCPFCDLTFTSADRFQAHVRRLHKDQARFDECDICQRKIYGKEYLLKHRRTHANFTERYPCDQCSKVFRRKWSLETHRKIHTFKKFVQCDICGEEFRFISEVDKHKHKVHQYDRTQASYECNVCKMKFATLSHLSIHSSHSHKPVDGKPFKCANCQTLFTTCVELKKHIYRSHQSGPCAGQPIKQEPADGYEESDASGNNSNHPLMGKVKDYVKKFVRSLPLETARGSEGIVPKTEPLDDDDLDEQDKAGVDAYNELTRQKMSQSNMAKRFVCETCQKCFSTKSDLRTHIRTHTGETPYKCDYCDRAFKQRGHRKLHIQVTHTKDMPYTCNLCGQSYPTRYRYQIHLKRHSGIKEHQCQYCDKAYYTVGKLNEHKRKHHRGEYAKEQT